MSKQQSDTIKLIAMVTMIIDHIGVILFPEFEWLRIIGRISFPLFAYQIGIGFRYTRNVRNYLKRMLVFGTVIQVGLILAILLFDVEEPIGMLNIFFTLALGVIAIYFYEIRSYFLVGMAIFAPIVLAEIGLIFDYGWYGVSLILLLYIVQKEPLRLISVALLALVAVWTGSLLSAQLFSVLSVPFMYRPKPLPFTIPSAVFYWFYPIHLVAIYAVGYFFILSGIDFIKALPGVALALRSYIMK